MKNNKIFCLDLGEKKTGIAYSDENHLLAFGLKIIHGDLFHSQKTEILDLCKTNSLSMIVIGLPARECEWKEKIKKFAEELCNELKDFTVEFQDEDFSSAIANENINELKELKSKKNTGIADDMESARIILQRFLDAKLS